MVLCQLPAEAGEDADEALRVQELRAVDVVRPPMRLRMESQHRRRLRQVVHRKPQAQRRLRVERVPRADRVRQAGVAPRRQVLLAPAARRRAEGSPTGPAMERLRRDS